jgi:hypothetical protein
VGPRAGLDAMEKRKSLAPDGNQTPAPSLYRPGIILLINILFQYQHIQFSVEFKGLFFTNRPSEGCSGKTLYLHVCDSVKVMAKRQSVGDEHGPSTFV